MKLLTVDSDRYLVEMLTTWLKTPGFDVRRAYTGERAKIELGRKAAGHSHP
jgi:DNA-binding response OmpR family regulator